MTTTERATLLLIRLATVFARNLDIAVLETLNFLFSLMPCWICLFTQPYI